MKTYKTIIIDDERLARAEVRRALEAYPEFIIAGEAGNADVALALIEEKVPNIIFLDIHMPKQSGFDLLEALNIVPMVVFTTAYNQHAVKAFEYNALDYLVKPIREERFAKTMQKVKGELSKLGNSGTEPFLKHGRIFIRDGEKCHFIPVNQVSLIESLENYVRLYFDGKSAMIKRSLSLLEAKLDSTIFFRINRSQIINTEYIREIHPHFKNKLQIILTTGKKLEVSSRQSAKFKKWNSL